MVEAEADVVVSDEIIKMVMRYRNIVKIILYRFYDRNMGTGPL